jgi:hypothetical protein
MVSNCKVSIKDTWGNNYPLFEVGEGTYMNNSLFAKENETYSLNVVTPDSQIYQSQSQKLPPFYKQDSIYGAQVTKTVLESNSDGTFYNSEQKGIETFIDLSSESGDVPKCRYSSRVTVMYTYGIGSAPPITISCWQTFTPEGSLNLTNSSYGKTKGIIKEHSICFFQSSLNKYDSRLYVSLFGFLVAFKKYNLSPEAYEFYKKEKEQIEASGKLFDPIPSQVLGNIKCLSNPSNSVYGFFEVTSVEQFYIRYSAGGTKLTRQSAIPGFVDFGETDKRPAFWLNQ